MSLPTDTDEVVELARQAREVELFKHLVELQGKIIEVAQQNEAIEKQCSALRKELDLRNSTSFRPARWFRIFFKGGSSRPAVPQKANHTIHPTSANQKESAGSTRTSMIGSVSKLIADARWRLAGGMK
jgi:hypothetical protein